MTIGLFAYSIYSLWPYYDKLRQRTNCVWAVYNRALLEELEKEGARDVVFADNPTGARLPRQLASVARRLYRLAGQDADLLTLQRLASKVEPDLWVSDTSRPLMRLGLRQRKVQVFHSLPYKAYAFLPPTADYDLILVPSKFYKDEFLRRFPRLNPQALQIVGWPRVDIFQNPPFARDHTLQRLGLDPRQKTVLFAPTWSVFPADRFFPVTWGDPYVAFESLCRFCQLRGINFVIKLHNASLELVKDRRLRAISERHGALWFSKVQKEHIEDPRELLYASDLVISDMSGIVNDFLPLDRPVVFIDVDDQRVWSKADLTREDRAGDCATDLQGLTRAVETNLENPAQFAAARARLRAKLFDDLLDGRASERGANAIVEFYETRA